MLYDRLKLFCTNKGTSVTNLCEQVTGSRGNLVTWKKGYMRSDQLAKCAEILDVPVGALLYDDEPILAKASKSEWDAILEGLSDDSLLQLRDYVKYLYWKQAQAGLDNE